MPPEEEHSGFVGIVLPALEAVREHEGRPPPRPATAVAHQDAAMHRLDNIRRAAYFYADELAAHLATGASNDGDFVSSSDRIGSGNDHHQSQAFHNTFTAIGDMATALAHHYAASRDAKAFSVDMSSSCYLLAIQLNGMSRRDLCPMAVYQEVVAVFLALDEALGAVARKVEATPLSRRPARGGACRHVGDVDDGDRDEMVPLHQAEDGGAGGLSTEATSAHASDSSELHSLPRDAAMLTCLCTTSEHLQRILKLMHRVCSHRHYGLFDNIAVQLHAALLLPSHEDARALTWLMAVALGLSVVFVFLEANLLFSRDHDKKMLVLPGVMLLAPPVAAAATRLLVPQWVHHKHAITKPAVACVCSLAVSLASAAVPPTAEGVASNTRTWGITVAFLLSTWRCAGTPAVVALSVLLYCCGCLVQLSRGSTDLLVQQLVTAVSLAVVLGTGVFVLLPIPQLHVSSLRCSRRMLRAMAHTAGVQLMQNGLLTPLWQQTQQQQQQPPHIIASTPLHGGAPNAARSAVAGGVAGASVGLATADGSSGTLENYLFSAVGGSGSTTMGAVPSGASFHLGALMEHMARDYGLTVRCDGRVKAVQGNVDAAANVLGMLLVNIANLRAHGTLRGVDHSTGAKSAAAGGAGPGGVVAFRLVTVNGSGNNAANPTTPTAGGNTSQLYSLWCVDLQHVAPSTIAAARSASETSGLSLVHTKDHGLVLRFRASGDGSGVQLHMAVSPNQGDETVLIVHPSPAVQWTLAQLMWAHGIATCVQQEFQPTADTNVSTFSGVLLPMDMFCEGALVDEVDLPTLFPFAFIGALDIATTAHSNGKSMPPSASPDSMHIVLRGLPSHANTAQYHRFVMEVRLRSATKYPLQQPTVFHNPAPMRKLGQGSVGVVHKVRLEDGTMVAMKVMRSKLLANYNVNTLQCLDEERRKMDLQHPNILNVLHAEQHAFGGGGPGGGGGGSTTGCNRGGEVVVYMELCSNVNLRSLLQCGPLSHREASRITLQLLCGLEYLHRHGSFAGDLKSENILFGPLRRVKIADYCSAFTTLHWRAPEFRDAAPQSPEEREQADVWALGCVQLEILFGRDYVPFSSSVGVSPSLPPSSGGGGPYAAAGHQEDPSAPLSMEPVPAQRMTNPLDLRPPPLPAVNVQFVPSSVQTSFHVDAILPPSMHHDWRSFIAACLQRDPSRRAKLDALCGHRFVNSVGANELLPMSSDERAQFDTLRAGPNGHGGSSSGGGGSSVNWPKAEGEAGDE